MYLLEISVRPETAVLLLTPPRRRCNVLARSPTGLTAEVELIRMGFTAESLLLVLSAADGWRARRTVVNASNVVSARDSSKGSLNFDFVEMSTCRPCPAHDRQANAMAILRILNAAI
mmetsp:Transcript_119044/g.210487  ORF Transcript_119044/g.210487 Transcript_119044/m.210487 type:complete len:117 (+) Transcript_119044:1699-2049(+)